MAPSEPLGLNCPGLVLGITAKPCPRLSSLERSCPRSGLRSAFGVGELARRALDPLQPLCRGARELPRSALSSSNRLRPGDVARAPPNPGHPVQLHLRSYCFLCLTYGPGGRWSPAGAKSRTSGRHGRGLRAGQPGPTGEPESSTLNKVRPPLTTDYSTAVLVYFPPSMGWQHHVHRSAPLNVQPCAAVTGHHAVPLRGRTEADPEQSSLALPGSARCRAMQKPDVRGLPPPASPARNLCCSAVSQREATTAGALTTSFCLAYKTLIDPDATCKTCTGRRRRVGGSLSAASFSSGWRR